MVMQWVDLRPIFEVFTGKGGYEGCGLRREVWWRQGATYKNLEQPWKKCCGKQGVRGNREREPCIRNQERVDMHIGYSG